MFVEVKKSNENFTFGFSKYNSRFDLLPALRVDVSDLSGTSTTFN